MNSLRTCSLIVAMALLLSTMAAVSMLKNLTGPSEPHLTEQIILTGQVHHFYMAAETWRNFPHEPGPIALYVDFTALGVMGAFIGAIVMLGRRRRISWTLLGWAVVLSAAIPYVVGLYALRDNVVPERAGPWMATMLMSVLYAAIALSVLTVVDMVGTRRAAVASTPVPQPA